MRKGTKLRILLLEDDLILSEIVCEFLEECGYEVVCVYDGEKAVDKGYEESFDAFVFDVKVPAQSGHDVLKQLRESGKVTPTIFVTSLASVEDLSKGYEVGCDDYLKKPFELKELELRLHALLKRGYYHKNNGEVVINDKWSLDTSKGLIIGTEGEFILARKEIKILKLLLSCQGTIVTHEQIVETAWGYDDEVSEESVRTHIKKLRKILGKEMIQNIRGQGYILVKS